MNDGVYLSPRVNPGRASDSGYVLAHGDRQGNLFVSDRVREAAMSGKLFIANFGVLTAPLVGPATQAVTVRRPSAWLRVSQGKVIYIVRHTTVIEVAGATTQGELLLATSSVDVGDGTGADASLIQNANPKMLSDTPGTTGRQLATGDVAVVTNIAEIDRDSFAADAVNLKYEFNANEMGFLVPIVGPATFLCYVGGNAVNFFAQTLFIEEDADLAS